EIKGGRRGSACSRSPSGAVRALILRGGADCLATVVDVIEGSSVDCSDGPGTEVVKDAIAGGEAAPLNGRLEMETTRSSSISSARMLTPASSCSATCDSSLFLRLRLVVSLGGRASWRAGADKGRRRKLRAERREDWLVVGGSGEAEAEHGVA